MKVSCWLNDPTASQDRRLNNESDPKEMHNIFKNDFLEIVTCRVSRYNPEEKGDRRYLRIRPGLGSQQENKDSR
jgi:hypothetical protein